MIPKRLTECCSLEGHPGARLSSLNRRFGRTTLLGLVILMLQASAPSFGAATVTTLLTPWVPLFKGVFAISGTNYIQDAPGLPITPMVMNALRVDLLDPDVRLFTTPRFSNYVENASESAGLTVSQFVATNKVQAAINANYFEITSNYLPPMTPLAVHGLHISEGTLVSGYEQDYSASFVFDAQNRPSLIVANEFAPEVATAFTAVSGAYLLLVKGTNVASLNKQVANHSTVGRLPRSALGLSLDRRWLYLLTIDGFQPGYSIGATLSETADWLLLFGAADAINLDGGPSTTLSIRDTTGAVVRLNKPAALADSGRELTVASHLGIYAKPLPGFINDVVADADDTKAVVTWSTVFPSTSQVQFGLTDSMGLSTPEDLTLKINHSVTVQDLVPDRLYYFRVLSAANGEQHISSNFVFHTTNYVSVVPVLPITNEWKHSSKSDPLWMQLGFDDSGWDGPFPALFWTDIRQTGANPEVQPKGTQLPGDENNSGYPFLTQYFRTWFALPTFQQEGSLHFKAFVDDGAIFYLNGEQIFRLRMPETSDASTPATGYPCEGDATCADEFSIDLSSLPNLSETNCLAVELHNYNLRSPDITFGVAIEHIVPVPKMVTLRVEASDGFVVLSWNGPAAIVQRSSAISGPWKNYLTRTPSPVTIFPTGSRFFYRLHR